MNIFDTLNKKGICYAVVVSINSMRLDYIEQYSRDYFIVALPNDVKGIKGFKKDASQTKIVCYALGNFEIEHFKEISQTHFSKVQQTENGRVFELKEKSFKTHFNQNS